MNCIINFGKDGRENYSKGQRRLKKSIKEDVDLIFRKTYPQGCPPTEEVSHVFKPFMFKEAFDKGYECVLWLDASAVVHQSLGYVWDSIEKDGYFFIDNPGCPEAMWASEDQLEAIGCSIEEAERFTMCRSGMVGLKNTPHNRELIDWMINLPAIAFNGGNESSSDLFEEVRHDQVIFSWIIHRDRLYKHPDYLAQYTAMEDFGVSLVEFRGIT